MLEAGRPAPEFCLKDLSGQRQSLRHWLKRGPVLVVFFKISCPTCQFTLPFLERISKQTAVVGISQDGAEATREFLEYFHITFPVLIDPANEGYAVSNAYRLTNVPTQFLIQQNGKIAWALNGFHRAEMAGSLGPGLFLPDERVPEMKPG